MQNSSREECAETHSHGRPMPLRWPAIIRDTGPIGTRNGGGAIFIAGRFIGLGLEGVPVAANGGSGLRAAGIVVRQDHAVRDQPQPD